MSGKQVQVICSEGCIKQHDDELLKTEEPICLSESKKTQVANFWT